MSEVDQEEYASDLEDPLKSEDESLDGNINLDSEDEPDSFLDKINKYRGGIDKYRLGLDNMLKQRAISRVDYYNELIDIENFEIELNRKENKVALSEGGLELIGKLNQKREDLRKRFSTMPKDTFNSEMLKLVREEKQIILDYQIITNKQPKIDKLQSLPFAEKLNELINREEKLILSTASKAGIKLNKPKLTDANYDQKLIEYDKNFNYVKDNLLSGYKLALMNPTSLNAPVWELNYDPTLNSLARLSENKGSEKILTELELVNYGEPNSSETILSWDAIKDRKIPVVNSIGKVDLILFAELMQLVKIKGRNVKELMVEVRDNKPLLDFLKSLEDKKLYNIGRYKDPISNRYLYEIDKILISDESIIFVYNNNITVNIDISRINFIPLIRVNNSLINVIPNESIKYIYTTTKKTNEQGTSRRVFTEFEEYIKDLRENFEANIEKINDDNSKLDLRFKIKQIEYYLENGRFMKTDQPSVNEADVKIRRTGIIRLIELLSEYENYSEHLAVNLEEEITRVSKVNNGALDKTQYEFLIKKMEFIGKNYGELLVEYLTGKITTTIMINFEVPKEFPKDFTFSQSFATMTPMEKYMELMIWEPKAGYYRKYKNYITDSSTMESIDASLTNNNIFLDYREIRELYGEITELKRWAKMKEDIGTIPLPPNRDEFLWRFRVLNQRRNTLPSMRIYQVATVRERINNLNKISVAINNCGFEDAEAVADIIETAVFTSSKTDKQYDEKIEFSLKNYDRICSILYNMNQKNSNIKNIVVLTHFFMNNGSINDEKIKRLIKLILDGDIDGVKSIINPREAESITKIFNSISEKRDPSPDNHKEFSRFFKILNKNVQKREKLSLIIDDNNKYIKPTVSEVKPDYGIKYVAIGGKYIYGGYYPSLVSPNGTMNYTRSQLIELSNIFGLNIEADTQLEDLYRDTVGKIESITKERNVVIIEHKSMLVDTKDTVLINAQAKRMFTFRKLDGYPEPGVPLYVFKDHLDQSYCIPLRFSGGIPVYSNAHKQLSDNKIAIIDGPAVFVDTDEQSLTSEYYCKVEYSDHRGAKVFFKEGVYRDKIKYSTNKEINTCNFYKTKEDCNNPFSISISGNRCEWKTDICVSITNQITMGRGIWFWNTDDPNIRDTWFITLQSTRKAVIDLINSTQLFLPEIHQTIDTYGRKLENEKDKLENRSRTLDITNPDNKPDIMYMQVMTKKQLESAKEDDKNLRKISLMDGNLVNNIIADRAIVKRENIPDGYISVQIPVFSIVFIEKYDYVRSTKKTAGGKTVIRRIGKETTDKNGKNKEIRKSVINAFIAKKDKHLLDSPPASFFWFLKSPDYTYDESVVKINSVINKVKYIPVQKIIPTSIVPTTNLPLITIEDINRAILTVAFSTMVDVDGMLETYIPFEADQQVIEFCLENNINPLEINQGSTRLTLDSVISFFNSKAVKLVSVEDRLNSLLDKAVRANNIDLITHVIKEIKRTERENETEVDPDILIRAESELARIKTESAMVEDLALKIQTKMSEKKDESAIKEKEQEKDIINKYNKSINATSSQLSRKARKNIL